MPRVNLLRAAFSTSGTEFRSSVSCPTVKSSAAGGWASSYRAGPARASSDQRRARQRRQDVRPVSQGHGREPAVVEATTRSWKRSRRECPLTLRWEARFCRRRRMSVVPSGLAVKTVHVAGVVAWSLARGLGACVVVPGSCARCGRSCLIEAGSSGTPWGGASPPAGYQPSALAPATRSCRKRVDAGQKLIGSVVEQRAERAGRRYGSSPCS